MDLWFVVRPVTYWLSFHAPYACRHSGACCASGWDIDIDRPRVPSIQRAIQDGRISAPVSWYRHVPEAPAETAGVLAQAGGRCVFHRDPGCAIQTTLGPHAMPAACQHFPRIALIDGRGVFVTLSHYCPTAVDRLFDAVGPASIVEGPPVLSNGTIPEGLDARGAWPPLATPRRLLSLEEYSAWERRAVELLTTADRPEDALGTLDPEAPHLSDQALVDVARHAVPRPYRWPAEIGDGRAIPDAQHHVVGRYLASHAFASWTAYQGNGLRCTVLYLHVVAAVLRTEWRRHGVLKTAIRESDFLLRHLVDRQQLADRLSAL